MEIKWRDRHYSVQDNAVVAHQYVIMYCNTYKFSELPFCGTHSKTHGTSGLGKHYHLIFDQN